MELPKNITQIGEVSKDCKIYVEDYVISYMKQLNQAAQDKEMAVALYGRRQTEDGISYHFLYGACKLDFLQREVRHLSQAQQMEIEKLRKKYFPDLEFMGYRVLNGEMIEGLHLCEQEICRYIGGYARFYEKNDGMLAYMLDIRDKAEPEYVDQTKYEEVKKRQEQRRTESNRGNSVREKVNVDEEQSSAWLKRETFLSPNLPKMRLAAVGAFAILCLMGIGTFREDELAGDLRADNGEIAASASVNRGTEQKETLMMEDKLEQALLAENQSTEAEDSVEILETESAQPSEASSEVTIPTVEEADSEENVPSETAVQPQVTQTSQKGESAVAYIIQPGDTLIGICLRQYGSDVRVGEVCSLNDISDPDDIKEGQIILLPL